MVPKPIYAYGCKPPSKKFLMQKTALHHECSESTELLQKTPFCYLNCSGTLKSPRKKLAVPQGRQRTQLGMERVVDTKNINLVGSNTREECETDLRGREEAARGQTIERASERGKLARKEFQRSRRCSKTPKERTLDRRLWMDDLRVSSLFGVLYNIFLLFPSPFSGGSFTPM